eukprot:2824927-Lingulodinium_polyedra.AAC.1
MAGIGVPACRKESRASWHQMLKRLPAAGSASTGCVAAQRKTGTPRSSHISLRHRWLTLWTAVSTESC